MNVLAVLALTAIASLLLKFGHPCPEAARSVACIISVQAEKSRFSNCPVRTASEAAAFVSWASFEELNGNSVYWATCDKKVWQRLARPGNAVGSMVLGAAANRSGSF
jgi:hypothetical protein